MECMQSNRDLFARCGAKAKAGGASAGSRQGSSGDRGGSGGDRAGSVSQLESGSSGWSDESFGKAETRLNDQRYGFGFICCNLRSFNSGFGRPLRENKFALY